MCAKQHVLLWKNIPKLSKIPTLSVSLVLIDRLSWSESVLYPYPFCRFCVHLNFLFICSLHFRILFMFQTYIPYIIWAPSKENESSGVCDQLRFKPVCSATEASQNPQSLDLASIDTILSKQWTTKVLIRLRISAGWSVPLLFAYGLRHVFAWRGPYNNVHHFSSKCHCWQMLDMHFSLEAKLRPEEQIGRVFDDNWKRMFFIKTYVVGTH